MQTARNRYRTIVVGGGQAGLAAGYHLRQTRRSFLILDANQQLGDTWRWRWDSLRLFSPAQYSGLPGLPFPAPAGSFPTKDAMASYLENYARHFQLPIATGERVTRITRHSGEMVVECGGSFRYARNVVVATGAYSLPKIPDFAGLLNPTIEQFHSSTYLRPQDVAQGSVLVVGFGTSGVDIATELAVSGRRVFLSGGPTPQVLSKFVPAIFAARNPLLKLLGSAYWHVIHNVVTIRTPLGRIAKSQVAFRGQPLVRLNQADVLRLGVSHVPRVTGAVDGRPRLEDGRLLDVSAVIWCTGFRPNYNFLDFPDLSFDPRGWPIAPHGIVGQIPGLYFLGIPFQIGLTSSLVGGVGRDAALVVRHIAARKTTVSAGASAPQIAVEEAI